MLLILALIYCSCVYALVTTSHISSIGQPSWEGVLLSSSVMPSNDGYLVRVFLENKGSRTAFFDSSIVLINNYTAFYYSPDAPKIDFTLLTLEEGESKPAFILFPVGGIWTHNMTVNIVFQSAAGKQYGTTMLL
jgi:hypothetical protein